MKGMAMLSYAGGLTMLPAETPYDLQLLDDIVGSVVRRSGDLQLGLNGKQWLVKKIDDAEHAGICVACHLPLRGILYSRQTRMLCPSCARREVRL
jgi:hypothetical protein